MFMHTNRLTRGILWSVFFIVVGVVLLLSNYGLISYKFDFGKDWPVLLVILGAAKLIDIIASRGHPKKHIIITGSGREDRGKILDKVERGELTVDEAARKLSE